MLTERVIELRDQEITRGSKRHLDSWKCEFFKFGRCCPVPYILGELRDNTTSVGWKKNYPWYMVHFNFFRNKTFLFVKIENWFFHHLFDLGFREILQNFSSFRQHSDDIFLWGIKVVRMSWNFVLLPEILNQTDAENFRFLSWWTKKFYF